MDFIKLENVHNTLRDKLLAISYKQQELKTGHGCTRRIRSLAISVYKIMANCRDYGFKDQITRASLSIPSNIPEGYERNFKKDFANFLRFTKGSCAELRTQLQIGKEIEFIKPENAINLKQESLEISKMLQGLINHIIDT